VFWNECEEMLARSIRDSKALASMAKVKSAGRVLMLPYTSTSMDSVTGRDVDVYVPLKRKLQRALGQGWSFSE
jgi:hypothetical protein